jgi:hypothetical protein
VTRLNVNEAVCEALFASPLQPSDRPTAETVAHAIGSTLRRLGPVGCATQMAQEFGDHPEIAIHRMRWARQLTDDFSGRLYFPTAVPSQTVATRGRPAAGARVGGGSGMMAQRPGHVLARKGMRPPTDL